MRDRDRLALGAASSPAEAIERLKELIAQAQRGEIECMAVRMFKKAGAGKTS